MNKIIGQYNQLVASQKIVPDAAQLSALERLSELAQQLESAAAKSSFFWQRKKRIKGVYLFGPVGRGKSMIMDLFFAHVAITNKQRLHFHHFMAWVHERLQALQGQKNPMQRIAKEYAVDTRLLCFDEFFVTDIGDAMIMARLFEALFAHGVVLVATSNCEPQHLYRNGLQRSRFLPTIALLEAHCDVYDVSGEQDYRLQGFAGFSHYFQYRPDVLIQRFEKEQGTSQQSRSLTVHHRKIQFLGLSASAGCIDFFELCGLGRASADYMVLAQEFNVLYVDNVPAMGMQALQQHTVQGVEEGYIRERDAINSSVYDDEARRFIALVDEFYDNGKLIVIAAHADIDQLYQGERLAFEYARTQSRLIEMQRWPLPDQHQD